MLIYLFIVSDYEYIRKYFIEAIANLDNIISLDDMKTSCDDNILMEELKKQSVLLLNADKKAELIRQNHRLPETYNALYYRLIFKREFLAKPKKSIVIVCDEDTIKPILRGNQSLASVSNMFFVDDNIKSMNEEKNNTSAQLVKRRKK